MPVSIESRLVGVTPARFTTLQGALSVIVGESTALLHPVAPALVHASRGAAAALAPAAAGTGDAAPVLETGLATRAVQAVLPAAGRTFEAVSSARSVALPIASAVLGLAAGTLVSSKRNHSKQRRH
jgi:hypothetical protein